MSWSIVDDLPASATDGQTYQHVPTVLRTDQGAPLLHVTWKLVDGPPGMTVDPGSGAIVWKATFQDEPIEGKLKATVTDAQDVRATAELPFTIDIRGVPPRIKPIADIAVTSRHRDLVVQPELDGECTGPVAWEVYAPASRTLSFDGSSGRIRWRRCDYRRQRKDPPDRRVVEVEVRAIGPDRTQGPAVQRFRIEVLARPPRLAQPPDATVWELDDYEYQLESADEDQQALDDAGDGPFDYRLKRRPEGASVSRTGLVEWTSSYSASPVDFEAEVSGPGGRHSVSWTVDVRSEAPKMRQFTSRTLKAGRVYRREVEFTKGVGEIELVLEGAPPKMRFNPVGTPARTCEIVWRADCAGTGPEAVDLKLVASHPDGTHRISWTLTVEKEEEDDDSDVAPCPANTPSLPQPCCDPVLEINCMHWTGKSSSQDLRAGTHGWSTFHVSPFPGVNPRGYHLVLPLGGAAKANETPGSQLTPAQKKLYVCGGQHPHPVLQVQAGYRQNPDTVDVVVKHADGCAAPHVLVPIVVAHSSEVRKSSRLLKQVRRRASDSADSSRYTLDAAAHGQVMDTHVVGVALNLLGDLYVLANLNPFRWRHLIVNRWLVDVKDATLDRYVDVGGQRLSAVVEAYPDIRWEVNCTLSRSSQTEEGGVIKDISSFPPQIDVHRGGDGKAEARPVGTDDGWQLHGVAKCVFDQSTFDVSAALLSNLENSIPFLSTLDSAADFLKKVGDKLPLGFAVGLRMPSLTVYAAAEPFEQDDNGLLGYQFKLGFYAAPLIGIEIEWNLLQFVLSVIPVTAPIVPVLQALKTGVGVQGVARLRVDVGIYLIAGGQVGLELEWARQWPKSYAQYGQIDGRVDFRIEGRAEAECEVLIVNGGAGLRVGAKTAIGLVGKGSHATGSGGLAFQGQARWEGIVLYFIVHYRCGLKIGVFKRGAQKTKSMTHVLCKPHYWPKPPKQHVIGGAAPASGPGSPPPPPPPPLPSSAPPPPPPPPPAPSSAQPAQLKEGGDVDAMESHGFDPFKGEGKRGQDVELDIEELARQSGVEPREPSAEKESQKDALKRREKERRGKRRLPLPDELQ